MPIVASSLTNVYASLDAYLTSTLFFTDGAPVPLRLHGVRRFIPPVDLPWIEAHYDFLGLQTSFRNRLTRTSAGLNIAVSERQGYLQLNGYLRARRYGDRYTTALIRDILVGAFPEGELIPVLNYASTNAPPTYEQEGAIVLDGTQEHVLDTGINSGIMQVVVQVTTRYLELYTRSS